MINKTIIEEKNPVNHVSLLELPFEANPLEVFKNLYRRCQYAYLLESIEGPDKLAQYSFIGFNPSLIVSTRDDRATITNPTTGEKTVEAIEDPLQTVKKIIKGRRVAFDKFRLVGGSVGYVSYDVIRRWEKLPKRTTDDLEFPDIEMGVYDDGIVFDHLNEKAYTTTRGIAASMRH